jgi:hypothetical protein
MPGDALFAGFSQGIDDKIIAHARDLVLKAGGDALVHEGMKPADRKALVDAAAKLAIFPPSVYAAGFETDAIARAVAASPGVATADPDPAEVARRWSLIPRMVGWHVGEMDFPGAQLVAAFKDFVAAWSRPGVAAALRPKLDGMFPAIRAVPLPKSAASWPKGAVQFVVDISPPASLVASGHHADAKARAGLKPVPIHFAVVPDGARAWVGLSADESLLVTKLTAAMAGSGDTLASRADLAQLKTASIGGGGFLTLAGASAELSAFAAIGGARWPNSGQTPHRGLTPIVLTGEASSPTPPSTATFTVQVPRAVIDDVVQMIAHDGGF